MTQPQPAIDETDRCPSCGAAVDESWLVCAWCGGQLSSPAELASGVRIDDRYDVIRVLGRGGFGITYEAVDSRLQRRVAIKELFPPAAVRHGSRVLVEPRDRSGFVAARVRFQREAAALARFSHPGIVRVYEVFEMHNTAYLVMELLEGESLFQVLTSRGGVLAVDEVLDAALRIGGALEAVHEAGLLHRDVNPTNAMLDRTGRVVLIDFGLARSFEEDLSATVTRAVTPGYAPPEQYAGVGEFGPPCDVYGLAATTYKLLTGVTPLNVFERQAGKPLTPPHVLRPDIPEMVSHAVLDGMELKPAHRPASAQAFLDRLGLHGHIPAARARLAGGTPAVVGYGRDVTVAPAPPPAAPAPQPAAPAPQPAAPAAVPPRHVEPSIPLQVLDVGQPQVRAAFAPWHDGGPPVVGPPAQGRGWVTVPVAAAVVALASSTPAVVLVILGFVLLPGLATVGDLVVHRHRQAIGATHRGWHRAEPATVAPMLFARNVAVALVRAIPAIALMAVGVVTANALGDNASWSVWRDLAVRTAGAAAALTLVVPARHGVRTFRSDMGLSAGAAWAMEGRDRPTTRTAVVWVIAVFLAALGVWLRPELWPLPG